MTQRRIIVVGTGTGIGKTHVGCALLDAWGAGGQDAVGLKPVESGVPGDGGGGVAGATPSDQERLWNAGRMFHVKREHALGVKRSLYAFSDPVSPHLASKWAAVPIELAPIEGWVNENAGSITLIETPGGLFSPLGPELTNFDLVRALKPGLVLLVAPDRLGVLHDVTATIGLATARGLQVDGLVLSAPLQPDSSTGANASELAALGIAFPLAVFPRAHPTDPESGMAAGGVIRWTISTHGWN